MDVCLSSKFYLQYLGLSQNQEYTNPLYLFINLVDHEPVYWSSKFNNISKINVLANTADFAFFSLLSVSPPFVCMKS